MRRISLTDQESRVYRHEALSDTREIRLLRVQKLPGNNHWTNARLSVIHSPLDDCPSYEAVSYVWGDAHATQEIDLSDGSILRVTASLARAMPYLERSCQTGYLWIDQISINQSSIAERNEQVMMMGEIYRRSSRCIVWIDTDSSITGERETRLTWGTGTGDAVRRCLQSFRIDDVKRLLHAPISVSQRQLQTFEFVMLNSDYDVREHLLWFLEHPWFTRTWVFQEFIMPKEAVFVISDFELPGEELETVFELSWPRTDAWLDTFHRIFKVGHRRATIIDRTPGLNFLISAFATRALFGGFQVRTTDLQAEIPVLHRSTFEHYESCTFIDMLYGMAASEASDPRDHVYALLGFAPFLLRHMRVDYTVSVEQAFAAILKACLKESRSLDFMAYAPTEISRSRSRLKLPSWVPNWSVKHYIHTITCQDNLFCASGKDFGLPDVPGCRHYDATSLLWEHQEWNELVVVGTVIDKVQYVLRKSSVYQVEPITSIDIQRGQVQLPWEHSSLDSFLANLVESGCDLVEELSRKALLRTLLMDGVQWAAIDALASGENLFRTGLKVIDVPHYTKIDAVIDALLQGVPLNQLPHKASATLLHELSKIQFGRRIALTEKRCFINAQDLVEPNDVITLLHGSRVPVILRERLDGAFTLVGQCYYDGAMYGEMAIEGDDEAITFKLL